MKRWKSISFLFFLGVLAYALNCHVMAQPSAEYLKAIRSVETLRIVVNQSYHKADGIELPFEDEAQRFLEYAGVTVVGVDAKDYDLTLRIRVDGAAKSLRYTLSGQNQLSSSLGVRYSGASVSGIISLEIPGLPSYKKSFRFQKSRKVMI